MLIWTDRAILHITDFIKKAKEGTEETAKEYMNKLVDFTYVLETMPMIGKKLEYMINNYEIRQLIYKKHKILYYIKENNIVILAIIHTRLDINSIIKRLNK